MKTEYHVQEHSYVFVVLEHAVNGGDDAEVHGVYINREEAQGKRRALERTGAKGYLSVLKKPLLGKRKYIYQEKNSSGLAGLGYTTKIYVDETR